MNSPLLISALDFKGYRLYSSNLHPDRLETYIREAQDFDLKAALGDRFYFDLLKNYREEDYQKLLNGEEYTNSSGDSFIFSGLKRALVYFTDSRAVRSIDVHNTATGLVVKTSEYSQPLGEKRVGNISTESRSQAIEIVREAELYITEKKREGKFLKFGSVKQEERSGSVRIKRIGGLR